MEDGTFCGDVRELNGNSVTGETLVNGIGDSDGIAEATKTVANDAAGDIESDNCISISLSNEDGESAHVDSDDGLEEDELSSFLPKPQVDADRPLDQAAGDDSLDHPLRSLSCIDLHETDSNHGYEKVAEVDHPDIPDVKISAPGKCRDAKKRRHEEHANTHNAECIPLRNIFHPEGPVADRHWAEQIGYKNWLIHLARRRRCELLILTGFLMWLVFFIVLAIVLNGNSSKTVPNTPSDQSGGKKSSFDTVNTSGFSTFPAKKVASHVPNVTSDQIAGKKSGLNTISTRGFSTISPAKNAASDVPNNKTDSKNGRQLIAKILQTKPYQIPEKVPPSPAESTTQENVKKSQTTSIAPSSTTALPASTASSELDGHRGSLKSTAPPSTETVEKQANYLIGVGRADITGSVADVNMMGYANPSQTSSGLHLRQFSRAFIVEDAETKVRTVFVNIDACMSSTLLKLEVLKKLKTEFGNLYQAENLCISGIHTHSGPAGFLQDVLFQITSLGYVDETLTAMVDGIVQSIRGAHNSIQPGYILMNKGELVGSNINRSPTAYANNPAAERAKYKYNVDTDMVLLKFMNENGEAVGMINWFPVHCTSMNNSNHLISSDNKGYAEILFEQFMNPKDRPGAGSFVAAFAQSNEGDVSPNTKGPHCTDTGEPCDNIHSTCNGKSQLCVATGPGKDMFESTKIIGENQFLKAKDLFMSASVKLQGPVKFIHQYIDMTNYEVVLNNSTKVKTCKPAMGFSFAAGTTDGPGAFDFKQGDKSGNKFWNFIRNFLHAPSQEQRECHSPKPILLDTGEMDSPYEWQPKIVDTQIFQFGQFLILALPGEFSTMAGRRLRDGVLDVYKSSNPDINYEAAIAGLANSYSDYITTYEEYHMQRYEGASTIYGPHTSQAYTQQFKKLAKNLIDGKNVTSSVKPVDIKSKLLSFQLGVFFDRAPLFHSFGDIQEDAKDSYTAGEEVSVKFVAGNPRNCLKVNSTGNMTFSTIEKETLDGTWNVIFTDADWDTRFTWIRTSTVAATSDAVISWQTKKSTAPGKYRINHYGYYKSITGWIYPYSGKSSVFTIKN